MTRFLPSHDGPVMQHEIEPGRSVPNHWRDDGPHLLERYADRKARLARERGDASALSPAERERAGKRAWRERKRLERLERLTAWASDVRRRADERSA